MIFPGQKTNPTYFTFKCVQFPDLTFFKVTKFVISLEYFLRKAFKVLFYVH
jgi:hypothetical protein